MALAAPLSAAEPNTLTAEELAEGWILLFDGSTLYGWEPASQANWSISDGAICVSEGEPGLLVTTSEFADYVLRLEFRHPSQTNSGVFLRTPPRPTDPAVDCYELNIAAPEVSPFHTGSLVGRAKAAEYAPRDDWQTFEVQAEGARIRIRLNGREVLDYTDPKPLLRGRIGLQFNSGAVQFRNVKLRPLGLQSLFNGRDLAGWKEYPQLASRFSVTPEGYLHVENGRGQLETERSFGDFILQLEVFVHGKGLNSGVFFRCIPGEVMNGYECQIHNGYKEGDRSQPLDCGTGGFYRFQNARRVVSDDESWTAMTLVVTGNHMAAWVNGMQVSDWTDRRAPHENPRQGLRTAPGTIILQGHDPTTKLSFRGLRATELPR
jgi:hypothetical protein